MAEYFIGMHFGFDTCKFIRDFKHNFTGIEFCNFNSEEIDKMLRIKKDNKFKIGVHFPLNQSNYKYRDPLLLSLDENEKNLAYEAVKNEVKYAAMINAEYLLIHFPKPMVLNKELDWEKCSFANSEIIYENTYPYELFKKLCFEAFEFLSNLSKQYKIQIVLEIEMLNSYLYTGNLLKTLLEKYPDIKLCLDSARIHVLSMIDNNFDYKKFLKEMAKYTFLLHLSNIRVTDKLENGHTPVLRELNNIDGWCNIEEFLQILSSVNKNVKVLFEHRSDILTDDELINCYSWVMDYFEIKLKDDSIEESIVLYD